MKKTWRKLSAPKIWRPQPGDVLEGKYVGRTLRDGRYGQYTVLTVRSKSVSYLVTGTVIVQLMDANGVSPGDQVRVVFGGYREYGDHGRTIKLFELWVPR